MPNVTSARSASANASPISMSERYVASGETTDAALGTLEQLRGVAGRLEIVAEHGGGLAVVDYAHKPEALVAALAILPDDARTAVVMAAQGFSGREIAEALGRTETSTRTMMFRARERLRTFLVAEGIAR